MRIRKIAQEYTKPITGSSHTSEIISKITPVFSQRISSWYVADGSVAWFLYEDGNEYEVTVTPARLGRYKSLREGEAEDKAIAGIRDETQKLFDSGRITKEQYDAKMQELTAGAKQGIKRESR